MKLRTILILDDSIESASEIKTILESHFFVLFTTSTDEAAQFIQENSNFVSAVCVSYELGNSKKSSLGANQCIQFIKAISQNASSPKIPLVVTAKHSSERAERDAMENGADDFIHAPYNAQVILRRFHNLIELHEVVSTVSTVTHDEITGLYTKRFFLIQASKLLEENPDKQYDFVCMDIERLKLVSDVCGTDVTKDILKQLGSEVLKSAKRNNGIAGNFSESVFFALIERPPKYEDEFFADFLKRVDSFPQISEFNLHIKLSFGIYHIENVKIPLGVMCECAQVAAEKGHGRYGTIFCIYDDEIFKNRATENELIGRLDKALENNEFTVYYQPKYDFYTKSIVGAEALVRWQSEDRGVLEPEDFIPLIEKTGNLVRLDMFVYERVCQDLNKWIGEGNSHIPISVNVFRTDLLNPNFIPSLLALVKKYNIPPRYLHLEITENNYAEDPEQVIKIIYELHKNDFVIEIDHFGSGYSSLNMLSELPIDILNLDIFFVRHEIEKTNGKGILYYVINLARQLDIVVVAEGVETKNHARQLTDLGCNYIQGFYFSKPLALDDFFALLRNSKISEMNTYLRQRETMLASAKSRARSSKSQSKGTMLIVDEAKSTRVVLSQLFKDMYDIVVKTNHKKAWEYIEENYSAISIIVLDLAMDKSEGFELLQKIRNDTRTRYLPIMATSEQYNVEIEQRALEMAADDFLAKPFKMSIMSHRIRNAVAHSLVQKLEQEKTMANKILEIERQAHFDFLTGLDTRTVLEKIVGEFFGKSKTFDAVFIMLDIDDFKTINDTLGHIAGDETIKKVAQILRDFFNANTCVCRMGGDEFSVFIPRKYSPEELEKMLGELSSKLRFNVEKIKVTCSIGVALSPEFGMDYQTLYNNSDMALLAAKRYGKNQFSVFSGASVLPSHIFYRNMDWVIDEFSDEVFVCNADTYEIIYINKLSAQAAGKPKKECIGKKCHKLFYNRDTPCDFCIPREHLMADFVQKTISFGKGDDDYATMRAKVVNWGGFDVRIQYVRKIGRSNVNFEYGLEDATRPFLCDLDKFPGGICKFEIDDALSIRVVNKELAALLNFDYTKFKEWLNGSLLNLIFADDRERIVKEISVLKESRGPVILRFRAVASNNSGVDMVAIADAYTEIVGEEAALEEEGNTRPTRHVYMNVFPAHTFEG